MTDWEFKAEAGVDFLLEGWKVVGRASFREKYLNIWALKDK